MPEFKEPEIEYVVRELPKKAMADAIIITDEPEHDYIEPSECSGTVY